MRIERLSWRGLHDRGFCAEFLMWTLSRRSFLSKFATRIASASPCQGEAIRN